MFSVNTTQFVKGNYGLGIRERLWNQPPGHEGNNPRDLESAEQCKMHWCCIQETQRLPALYIH